MANAESPEGEPREVIEPSPKDEAFQEISATIYGKLRSTAETLPKDETLIGFTIKVPEEKGRKEHEIYYPLSMDKPGKVEFKEEGLSIILGRKLEDFSYKTRRSNTDRELAFDAASGGLKGIGGYTHLVGPSLGGEYSESQIRGLVMRSLKTMQKCLTQKGGGYLTIKKPF